MAQISLDNGLTFYGPEDVQDINTEALSDLWPQIVDHMQRDIREFVHDEIAPCTEKEFLHRYLERAGIDIIIG